MKIDLSPSQLYRPENAAEILDVDLDTLERWRDENLGPEWKTIPLGDIRYYGSSLIEWITPDAIIDPRRAFDFNASA